MRDEFGDLDKIEARLPVENWVLEGFGIWPILRQVLSPKRMSKHLKIKRLFYQAQEQFLYSKLAPKRVEIAVLVHRGDRTVSVSGQPYDPVMGPSIDLIRSLGARMGILEVGFGPSMEIEGSGPPLNLQKTLDQTALIAKWNSRKPVKLRKNLEGLASGELPELDLGLREIHTVRLWAEVFKSQLMVLKPRVALLSRYYDRASAAFCLACHELQIPTIDLQAEGDPSYFNLPKRSIEGYEVLPDIFWTNSAADFDAVQSWCEGSRKHHAIQGGQVFLESALDPASALHREFYERAHRLRLSHPGAVHLVVTISKARGFTPEIRELVARAPVNWMWWISLEPELRRQISKIKKDLSHFRNVQVIDGTVLPVHALFAGIADIHVSEETDWVYTAERFAIPSIVMRKLPNDVGLKAIERPHEVIAYIKNHHREHLDGRNLSRRSQIEECRKVMRELISVQNTEYQSQAAPQAPIRAD